MLNPFAAKKRIEAMIKKQKIAQANAARRAAERVKASDKTDEEKQAELDKIRNSMNKSRSNPFRGTGLEAVFENFKAATNKKRPPAERLAAAGGAVTGTVGYAGDAMYQATTRGVGEVATKVTEKTAKPLSILAIGGIAVAGVVVIALLK